MKKKILLTTLLILVLLALTGCGSTTNSSRDWKKDAYEQRYYKGSNGK